MSNMIHYILTPVKTWPGFLSKMLAVAISTGDAKGMVMRYAERGKLNLSWLAEKIGTSRQSLHHWITGTHEPANPDVWLQMAAALGILPTYSTEFAESAREFALEVLVKSDDADLKAKAANLIREISKISSQ